MREDHRLGNGNARESSSLLACKECRNDPLVFLSQNRTGGIEELTAGRHARSSLAQHGKLQCGKIAIDIVRLQPPRDLGVPANGSRSRARRVHEDGIEETAFSRRGTLSRYVVLPLPFAIQSGERDVEIARIAGNRFDMLDARTFQTLKILPTFRLVQIECHVVALKSGTHRLRCHDVGLRAPTGPDFQTRTRTRRSGRDQLCMGIGCHDLGTVEGTGCDIRAHIGGRDATWQGI